MSLASLNRHTWMEYRYKYANDNEAPRRLWTCDQNNIFEVTGNVYVLVSNSGVQVDKKFSTPEEAKEFHERSLSSAG